MEPKEVCHPEGSCQTFECVHFYGIPNDVPGDKRCRTMRIYTGAQGKKVIFEDRQGSVCFMDERQERRDVIDLIAGHLSQLQKTVVDLRHVEQLTNLEIASILCMSEQRVIDILDDVNRIIENLTKDRTN